MQFSDNVRIIGGTMRENTGIQDEKEKLIRLRAFFYFQRIMNVLF